MSIIKKKQMEKSDGENESMIMNFEICFMEVIVDEHSQHYIVYQKNTDSFNGLLIMIR